MSFRVKPISLILATLMLWHYGGVRLYAQVRATQSRQPAQAASLTPRLKGIEENRFDSLLSELRDVVRDDGAKTKAAPERGFAGIERLNAIKDKLAAEDVKNQEYFAQLDQTILEKKLPAEIRVRHAEFVRQYQSKYDALMTHLESLESAHKTATGLWGKLSGQSKSVNWAQVIEGTTAFLDANTPQPRPRQRFDPNNLPHRSLKAEKSIAPKLTRDEWLKAFPKEAAQVGLNTVPPSGPTSGPRASAKTGDTLFPLATSPPMPADLAETIEVRFTPEIRQLADTLDRNPVKIYNWVRNNIEFVPTWGSIQGAQLCLETKSCNAFDTSSLLISLLRHSGVPTRYQMGTIEVPIEKAKNWLGGFTDANAAARFAASCGIPSAGTVAQGGTLRSIRMEHMWVRAYVDYAPSQGEVNNQGDTWVDLDPSFKLYRHTPGADVTGELAFDVTAFRDRLLATTTFNATDHSITNIDHAFIRSTFNTSITNFINDFPGIDPRTLLPARAVITSNSPVISAGLPYKILVRGPAASALMSEIRHSITVSVSDSTGGTSLTFSASLPELATKNISLFFTFATQADIDFVRSVAPPEIFNPNTPGNGQRLLDAIPAQLVGVRPVIQLNGVAAATGSRVGMGELQTVTVHFSAPTVSTADATLELAAWGRYGVTLDYAGISETTIRARSEKFQSLVQEYQTANGRGLSVSPINAAFYDLIISSWFFSVDHVSELFSKSFNVRYARYPSLGFTYPEFTVTSTFGVPNRLSATSFFLDVARQFQVVTALDGDANRETGFNITIGFQSSELEGSVLARLLSDQTTRPPGLSAASALRSASTQGIPIHAIDAVNIGTVLPRIADSFPKNAISDAVNGGRVVIVPQRPPVIAGVSINGYITIDPQSGDGAYLIGRAGAGLRRPCDPPLTPAAQTMCAYIFYQLDQIELFASIVLLFASLLGVVAAVVAAITALVEAIVVTAGIISATAALVVLLAALVALTLVVVNTICFLSCVTSGGQTPPSQACEPLPSSGCQGYLLRLSLFSVGLDDLPDLLDILF
ncbi:MAG: transglutaminase domain-containing protein [Pyrinomonadaceae bacterium]|nr:transglutaminase domain-containing protein [Pyrinomonadaceae bacterium]